MIIVVNTKISIKCKKCQVKIISKQTSSVKFRFYIVVELVIKTLISNQVGPAEILASLPSEIASRLRLEGAMTINDIFKEAGPLDLELKWYSFALLTLLVEKFGDSRCKQELNEYVALLRTYLQTRSKVNQTPSPTSTTVKMMVLQKFNDKELEPLGEHPQESSPEEESTSSNNKPAIKIFVDPEWDKKLVHPDSNKQEREYIAHLLGTTMNHIRFVQAT